MRRKGDRGFGQVYAVSIQDADAEDHIVREGGKGDGIEGKYDLTSKTLQSSNGLAPVGIDQGKRNHLGLTWLDGNEGASAGS